MKKSTWLVIGLILFLALSFLILVGIAQSFTSSFIKSQLTQKFYELTGRTLIINGDIHWSFFPEFDVKAENVVINNRGKFSEKPFAKADSVDLDIKIMSLLSRRVEIEDVFIKRGRVFFYDEKGRENIELDNLDLKIENVLDHSFFFNLSGRLKKDPNFVIDNITLSGTFNFPPEKDIWDISNINSHGHLQANFLPIGIFPFKDAQAVVDIKNGIVSLYPLTATLYNGNYSGDVVVDMNSSVPVVTLDGTLLKSDVGALIAGITKKNNNLFSGTANVKTKLKFIAGQKNTVLKTLNGTVRILIEHGILHGINIPALVERGQAIIKGQTLPPIANNQTDFGMLNATFQVQNGVMQNDDLVLQSSQLKVAGQGKIDLVNEKVDYRLDASLVGHKMIIPIVIQGSFDNLVVMPDVKQVLNKMLTEKTDQLLSQIMQGLKEDDPNQKNNLKEKVNEKLKKLHLESLFG